MDLQSWVAANGGGTEVARRLKLNRVAVWQWTARRSWPKTKSILKLIELSGGALTFESIILSTTPPKERRFVAKVVGS